MLSLCDQITDGGVVALLDGCPRLKLLDVDGCSGLSDAVVTAALARCRQLQELGLYDCPRIAQRPPPGHVIARGVAPMARRRASSHAVADLPLRAEPAGGPHRVRFHVFDRDSENRRILRGDHAHGDGTESDDDLGGGLRCTLL